VTGGSRRRGSDEAFDLLVPEGGELLERAKCVAEFARELGGAAERVAAPDLGRVQREYDREAHTRAGGAIEDLLVHHLEALHAGMSFASFDRARSGVQAAWGVLADHREAVGELPGVPEPGEGPLAVAGRLLGGLYRLDWDEARLELWRARLEHARGGPRAGERAFRERLASVGASDVGGRVHDCLLAGLVESQLDRGGLRDAELVIEEHAALASDNSRLRRLSIWIRLLRDDLAGALELQGAEPAWDGVLPHALVELREDWKEALPVLEGRAHRSAPGCFPRVESNDAPPSRADFGAALLAVFAFGPGRSVETLSVEHAPALRPRLDRWLSEREGACCVRTLPEHALVIEAQTLRRHGQNLPSALGRGARALALVPILDEIGEVAGWVHLETEHHLLPARVQLDALAQSWRLPILRRGHGAHAVDWPASDRVREALSPAEGWDSSGASLRLDVSLAEPARALCAETFEALVQALGVKLSQRRWWGFTLREGETEFVASGGEGLGDAQEATGGARAIERSLATGGIVRFDEPDERLYLNRSSASGFVLPLVERGGVQALFVLESSRRRDFRAEDVERHGALAAHFCLPLAIARFRAWHIERFGFDLYFDTSLEAFREFADQIHAAAGSASPVVLSGPGGAGKMVLARWLHWSGGQSGANIEVFHCGLDPAEEEARVHFAATLRGATRGTLILDDVQSLVPELQEELLVYLEGPEGQATGAGDGASRARLVATTPRSLADSVERGDLRADLAARLDRLQIFTPALADRRREIPGLTRFLAGRFAAEEGMRPPIFGDDALALLWRQPWQGNLRDLEALVFKLSLLHPGEEVGAQEIRAVARRFKSELLAKLPPRRPRRSDLVAALRTTMKSTGRFNKRRAALYLGWDPDTLAARLSEAELDESALAAEAETWGI